MSRLYGFTAVEISRAGTPFINFHGAGTGVLTIGLPRFAAPTGPNGPAGGLSGFDLAARKTNNLSGHGQSSLGGGFTWRRA